MDLLHLHFQGDCNSGEVQFSGSRSANPSSEMPGESSCFALDVLPYNSRTDIHVLARRAPFVSVFRHFR